MLKEPKSAEECVYFTSRVLEDGKIRAWVFKEKCEKCGKALMGKPVDEKTGKPKIRAKEYVCNKCGFSEDKEEYEDKLTANIIYTCPDCKNEDEVQIPYKRQKIRKLKENGKKESVEVLRFKCGKCDKDIDITKKMK